MAVVPKLLKIFQCYEIPCQLDPVAVTTGQSGRSENRNLINLMKKEPTSLLKRYEKIKKPEKGENKSIYQLFQSVQITIANLNKSV